MENKNSKQSSAGDTGNDKLGGEQYENLSNLSDENASTENSASNQAEGEDVVTKVIPRAFSSSALRIKDSRFSFWERMHSGTYDTDNAGSTNSPVR